jgi:hypothetical protein
MMLSCPQHLIGAVPRDQHIKLADFSVGSVGLFFFVTVSHEIALQFLDGEYLRMCG